MRQLTDSPLQFKGDPVDVANFSMMLHLRGSGITPAAPQQGSGITLFNPADESFATALQMAAVIALCDEKKLSEALPAAQQ